MKKTELVALVRTLRIALEDAHLRRDQAEQEAQRERTSVHSLVQQVRALEQRLAAPAAPAPPPSHRIAMEDSYYRPARAGEPPDILVTDLREGHQAQNLPYVKVR